MNNFLDNLLITAFTFVVIGVFAALVIAVFGPSREKCRDGFVEMRGICVQGYVPGWKQ